MDIRQAIEALGKQKVQAKRRVYRFWWGTHDQNRDLFKTVFTTVDGSVGRYQHLPEYEEIIDWMTDSKGKGLFLMGDCGRGKSTILTGVLPVLFYQHLGKVLRTFHSDEIPGKINSIMSQWAIGIDELGVEPKVNDYGERYEGFNRIINAAEAKIAPLFITTNLDAPLLLERYGERSLDRINRLCRKVKFRGSSFR